MDEQNINAGIAGEETQPENESEKIKKERDEYLEGWKRAKADFVNYKRDEDKRFEAIVKFGQEGLMRDLLTALDSFDLALAAFAEVPDLKGKGLQLIRSQLENILKKYGLEPLKIVLGDKFNPGIHDAIVAEDSDKESGTIIEEVEKGYMLNGRLLRAAKVKVAK